MNQNQNISDQELDALFKEASGSAGIPAFNDSFWNEMEAMLPKKKRKGILFWRSFAAASVVVVLGILFLILPANHKNKAAANEVAKNSNSPMDNSSVKKYAIVQNADKSSDVQAIDHTAAKNPGLSNPGENNSITYPIRRFDKKKPAAPENQNRGNNSGLNREIAVNNEKTPEVESQKSDDIADLGKQPMNFTVPVTLNNVIDHSSAKKIPYYIEFGIGYGQSYKRVDFENNWMSQFKFGGGLYTTIGQMQLSAGVALRAEVPDNISKSVYSSGYNSQNVLVDVKNETTMRGLYSIEFPLFIGGTWNRSVLGASMTPGVQLAYTGFRTRYENTQVISREKQSGSIPDSKTMTMEIGLRYGYSITERVQLSASCNMDVIRPFQSTYYNGDNRNYPVSFFLGLRRTF